MDEMAEWQWKRWDAMARVAAGELWETRWAGGGGDRGAGLALEAERTAMAA